jgi:folate-binding protein YgfZ
MSSPAEPGFFRIAHRARFRIGGNDAARYLNGQLSIDIPRLAPVKARPACLLTAKGKLCALVQVWREGPGFIVECDSPLAESVEARLGRYIIADDVTVDPVEPPAIFHLLNPPEPPAGALAITRIGLPGFDTNEPPEGLREIPAAEVELLRILHGFPAWGAELGEDTLPQEARLESFAVDFDKGCYVGQETVSRLKSVGRVNQRLHGFLGELAEGPPAILHPPGDPATRAGRITSHARHFGMAQTAALGYLHRQFETLPRLAAADESGRTLGELERREFPIR